MACDASAGAEPDRGYPLCGASVGVLELADRVVGALQPANVIRNLKALIFKCLHTHAHAQDPLPVHVLRS